MLVNNGQFIQLTNDYPNSALNGQPLYIDSQKICAIRSKIDLDGNKNGSYVFIDGYIEDDCTLPVKESPEDIIGLINDGCFCRYSNKTPYDQIPYPEK